MDGNRIDDLVDGKLNKTRSVLSEYSRDSFQVFAVSSQVFWVEKPTGTDYNSFIEPLKREGNVKKTAFLTVLVVAAVGFFGAPAFAQTAAMLDSVQKISIDGLKAQLANPDLIVIDVRTAHDWEESKTKIKGAVREDFDKASSWVDKYPKEKTIVFYCK
jgi:hypothetical protein